MNPNNNDVAHNGDPRNCPLCGARGKRAHYTSRLDDSNGLMWSWVCPVCCHAWKTRLRALVLQIPSPFSGKILVGNVTGGAIKN